MSFIMPNRKTTPLRIQETGEGPSGQEDGDRFRFATLLDEAGPPGLVTAVFEACAAMAPDDVDLHPVEFADLPSFDATVAAADDQPAAVQAFAEAITMADGFLVVADAGGGALREPLTRALRWASFPEGADALSGLPVVVLVVGDDVGMAERVREQARQLMLAAGSLLVGEDDPAALLVRDGGDDTDERQSPVTVAMRQAIGGLLLRLRAAAEGETDGR